MWSLVVWKLGQCSQMFAYGHESWTGARRQHPPARAVLMVSVVRQSCASGSARGVVPRGGRAPIRVWPRSRDQFVLGADGGVEQVPVAQAHLGGGVAEDGRACRDTPAFTR